MDLAYPTERMRAQEYVQAIPVGDIHAFIAAVAADCGWQPEQLRRYYMDWPDAYRERKHSKVWSESVLYRGLLLDAKSSFDSKFPLEDVQTEVSFQDWIQSLPFPSPASWEAVPRKRVNGAAPVAARAVETIFPDSSPYGKLQLRNTIYFQIRSLLSSNQCRISDDVDGVDVWLGDGAHQTIKEAMSSDAEVTFSTTRLHFHEDFVRAKAAPSWSIARRKHMSSGSNARLDPDELLGRIDLLYSVVGHIETFFDAFSNIDLNNMATLDTSEDETGKLRRWLVGAFNLAFPELERDILASVEVAESYVRELRAFKLQEAYFNQMSENEAREEGIRRKRQVSVLVVKSALEWFFRKGYLVALKNVDVLVPTHTALAPAPTCKEMAEEVRKKLRLTEEEFLGELRTIERTARAPVPRDLLAHAYTSFSKRVRQSNPSPPRSTVPVRMVTAGTARPLPPPIITIAPSTPPTPSTPLGIYSIFTPSASPPPAPHTPSKASEKNNLLRDEYQTFRAICSFITRIFGRHTINITSLLPELDDTLKENDMINEMYIVYSSVNTALLELYNPESRGLITKLDGEFLLTVFTFTSTGNRDVDMKKLFKYHASRLSLLIPSYSNDAYVEFYRVFETLANYTRNHMNDNKIAGYEQGIQNRYEDRESIFIKGITSDSYVDVHVNFYQSLTDIFEYTYNTIAGLDADYPGIGKLGKWIRSDNSLRGVDKVIENIETLYECTQQQERRLQDVFELYEMRFKDSIYIIWSYLEFEVHHSKKETVPKETKSAHRITGEILQLPTKLNDANQEVKYLSIFLILMKALELSEQDAKDASELDITKATLFRLTDEDYTSYDKNAVLSPIVEATSNLINNRKDSIFPVYYQDAKLFIEFVYKQTGVNLDNLAVGLKKQDEDTTGKVKTKGGQKKKSKNRRNENAGAQVDIYTLVEYTNSLNSLIALTEKAFPVAMDVKSVPESKKRYYIIHVEPQTYMRIDLLTYYNNWYELYGHEIEKGHKSEGLDIDLEPFEFRPFQAGDPSHLKDPDESEMVSVPMSILNSGGAETGDETQDETEKSVEKGKLPDSFPGLKPMTPTVMGLKLLDADTTPSSPIHLINDDEIEMASTKLVLPTYSKNVPKRLQKTKSMLITEAEKYEIINVHKSRGYKWLLEDLLIKIWRNEFSILNDHLIDLAELSTFNMAKRFLAKVLKNKIEDVPYNKIVPIYSELLDIFQVRPSKELDSGGNKKIAEPIMELVESTFNDLHMKIEDTTGQYSDDTFDDSVKQFQEWVIDRLHSMHNDILARLRSDKVPSSDIGNRGDIDATILRRLLPFSRDVLLGYQALQHSENSISDSKGPSSTQEIPDEDIKIDGMSREELLNLHVEEIKKFLDMVKPSDNKMRDEDILSAITSLIDQIYESDETNDAGENDLLTQSFTEKVTSLLKWDDSVILGVEIEDVALDEISLLDDNYQVRMAMHNLKEKKGIKVMDLMKYTNILRKAVLYLDPDFLRSGDVSRFTVVGIVAHINTLFGKTLDSDTSFIRNSYHELEKYLKAASYLHSNHQWDNKQITRVTVSSGVEKIKNWNRHEVYNSFRSLLYRYNIRQQISSKYYQMISKLVSDVFSGKAIAYDDVVKMIFPYVHYKLDEMRNYLYGMVKMDIDKAPKFLKSGEGDEIYLREVDVYSCYVTIYDFIERNIGTGMSVISKDMTTYYSAFKDQDDTVVLEHNLLANVPYYRDVISNVLKPRILVNTRKNVEGLIKDELERNKIPIEIKIAETDFSMVPLELLRVIDRININLNADSMASAQYIIERVTRNEVLHRDETTEKLYKSMLDTIKNGETTDSVYKVLEAYLFSVVKWIMNHGTSKDVISENDITLFLCGIDRNKWAGIKEFYDDMLKRSNSLPAQMGSLAKHLNVHPPVDLRTQQNKSRNPNKKIKQKTDD